MKTKTLIIDDNEDFRNLVCNFLKPEPGFVCTKASGGKEALNMLNKEKFDLVLLDIMMPDLNGVQVLKKLRETDDNLKVIMLTTCNQRDIVWECLDGKADDYLLKPISKNSLMDKLKMAKQ